MESIEVKKERPGEASTDSVALKEKMRRRRYARLVVDMTYFDASRGGRCEYYFSVKKGKRGLMDGRHLLEAPSRGIRVTLAHHHPRLGDQPRGDD